jgi:signal transduction histidine kinase
MFLPSLQRNAPVPPKATPPISPVTSVPRSAWAPFISGERPTVLFLGVDHNMVTLVHETLEHDVTLISSRNLSETLSVLNSHKPDLVLCDWQDQLGVLLQTMDSHHLSEIPLLLFTTPEERKSKASLLSGRVTDLLLKPCQAEELQARIRGHLQNYLAKKILQAELRCQTSNLHDLAQEITLRTKELHRVNKLKDEFMATLSHELRNPINVIAGFAEILKSGVDQPDLAREAADAIYRNAQVQIKLIADLLDISRGIAGKLILDSKPMQLNTVLQDILPAVREAAAKQELTLTVHSELNGDLIHGDAVRISQVMWNLLSNAIKFTPKGGTIEIHLCRKDHWIEFSVHDTGHGIDPKFLPYMFERFNQQDASITKRFGGLGLGLAIVRHIVELHGGTVFAQSNGLGQGATFTVRFPTMTN